MKTTYEFSKTVKHRQLLSVTLTDEEIRARGKQIAREIEEMHSAESERKELNAELGKKIQAHSRVIDQLSRVIDTGIEYRDVDVDIVYDFAQQEIRKVRIDTGEIFVFRRMTDEESQMQMEFEEQADKVKTPQSDELEAAQ